MYIPSAQQILTTGLAMTGCMTLKSTYLSSPPRPSIHSVPQSPVTTC